jgi:osmoprotectant transport system permease protein
VDSGENEVGMTLLADTFKPSTFVDAFTFIGDHGWLIWHKTVEQLVLSGSAMGVAIGIAIPIGVWLGHVHRGSFAAINISNIGRALPSLAVIAIALPFLGVGFWDVLLALVVLAVPLMITNAYVAVDGIDPDVVEAARGMGMRDRDVLLRVELPLAMPLLFAGIRTAAVYVVSTATIAAIAGGGGLGDIIVGQSQYRLEGVIGAAICVAALAMLADVSLGAIQYLVSPRGLRRRPSFEPDLPHAIPVPQP